MNDDLYLEEGLVHMGKDISLKQGVTTILTRCGETVHDKIHWTAWESEVTCEDCKHDYYK